MKENTKMCYEEAMRSLNLGNGLLNENKVALKESELEI